MPHLGGINFDEELYPNPEVFQPSRFLTQERTLRNLEHHIPFGIGKRSCLGEALARMELFIIATTLFQNFEFSAAAGGFFNIFKNLCLFVTFYWRWKPLEYSTPSIIGVSYLCEVMAAFAYIIVNPSCA